MSNGQIEYEIIKYTKITDGKVLTGLFIMAPGLLFPSYGREKFYECQAETLLRTTNKQEAVDAWKAFHTVLSLEEYMEIKTAHLGSTLGSEAVSSDYLNIKAKFASGHFIHNPITKRVEKSVSVFISDKAAQALRSLQAMEDDVNIKHRITNMAMEYLIGYSPNDAIRAQQDYFDILHTAINSSGKTIYSFEQMYDVVDKVWSRMSKKHRNAWRYSRYLNKSTYISLLNSHIERMANEHFEIKHETTPRVQIEMACMPTGFYTKKF